MNLFLLPFTFIFITTAVIFKEPAAFKDEIYTGKLVVKGPCGQRVVSVISPYKNSLKVLENWEDPVSSELYKNVFSVRNFCELASLGEGDTFYFKFIKMKMNVCNNCLLYRPVPEAEGSIIIVEKDSGDVFRYIKNL